ncbi:hypothetical protein RYD26_10205 [Pasteurellaceae bacterium LIM206]|nr:hypothetical protein [Pasteurellaceae bacterium LIM206]
MEKYGEILMKNFLKKINSKLVIDFKLGIVVSLVVTIYLFFNYISLLKNDKIINDYTVHHNITVHVEGNYINGKLNKYLTIKAKYKNTMCYEKYCGLPGIGEYTLSSIKFIKLYGDWYIQESCTKSNCFYNIDKGFIKILRENKLKQLKNDILWGGVFITITTLVGVLWTKYISD